MISLNFMVVIGKFFKLFFIWSRWKLFFFEYEIFIDWKYFLYLEKDSKL